MTDSRDRWHRWLLDVRFGGDADHRERMLDEWLYPVRDEILDRAQLRATDTLLDVGTGDGLLAFGALDRLGPAGRVVFSDISQDLLDHCRHAAGQGGQLGRCDFVLASADSLTDVPDGSVDVVTTRSVLIYVKDKAAALREFYRVLKADGRISLFEPINRLMSAAEPDRFGGYDIQPVAAIAEKVKAFHESLQPPDTDPMLDFDERDLVRDAEAAGFGEVRLDLRVTVKSAKRPCPWGRFLRMSGNPLEPPLSEVLDIVLTAEEIGTFSDHLRPLVESGTGTERTALAYLTAFKMAQGEPR
jgi:SAM-dependent methyltransferase